MPQRDISRPARPNWSAGNIEGGENLNPKRDGSLNLGQLERFFQDQYYEPAWRAEAEIDEAYYDGDQFTREQLERMKENGILPVKVNMIKPGIDAVGGLEIITRRDLRCVSVDDDSYESAQAVNEKFREAQKQTMLNQKVSDRYRNALVTGIAWTEVSRGTDPFQYPYRIICVPWREFFFDYRAREPDLSDRRYEMRSRWYDEDDLMAQLPKHKTLIKRAANIDGIFPDTWIGRFENSFRDVPYATELTSHQYGETRWNLQEDEWMNNHRGRVRMMEIIYSVPHRAEVMVMPTGHVVQFNADSAEHRELMASGQVSYRSGVTNVWRQAFYIGAEKVIDRPLRNNVSPYVPMVGYRKGSNGAPYGLANLMRSPQESLNSRWTRAQFDNNKRLYLIDNDAVENVQNTAKQMNKVMASIPLKSDRRFDEAIREMAGTETTAITFQMLQESKMNIYDVTGLHPEFMGRVQSAGQSGVAIDQLIEQSSKVLGVYIDNYNAAKMKIGQLLFNLVISDMMDMEDMEVKTTDPVTGRHRAITVNAMSAEGERTNDLLMARLEVELEPVPQSDTYRQQKLVQLTEIIKSMPPEMQGAMADLVVRAAQLPNGEEIIERIRSLTGFGPEPKDPEQRAQLQQQQEQQQRLEEQMRQIEMMTLEGEAKLAQAKAALERIKAEKMQGADTELTEAKTLSELAKAEAVPDEQRRKATETQASLLEASARLRKEKNQAEQPKPKPKAKK